MEQNEIIEGNKLIAEFMGLECTKSAIGKYRFYELVDGTSINAHTEVFPLYHTSWDWIFPVIEKIEKLVHWQDGKVSFQIFRFAIEYSRSTQSNDCKISIDIIGKNGLKHILKSDKDKLKSVWIAIVDFIKWYNNQKPTP